MREIAKPACLVLAALLSFPCGCASPPVGNQGRHVVTSSVHTRAKVEERATGMIKAEEETFQLLDRKMDEYQDTLALCEHVSGRDGEESPVKKVCREKLRALKSEIEHLSGLLQQPP